MTYSALDQEIDAEIWPRIRKLQDITGLLTKFEEKGSEASLSEYGTAPVEDQSLIRSACILQGGNC